MKVRFSPGPLFLSLLALAFIVSGCSSGSNKTTQPTTTAAATGVSNITLSNFAFSPTALTVPVGTTVTWTNKDAASHTVTSDTGVFNSGGMAQNATYSYTFNTAGTYKYHCTIHPTMTGTIIVQ